MTSLSLHFKIILPIKFRVNSSFRSGEEIQHSFSRWRPNWPFDKGEQNAIEFQAGRMGGHLGFPAEKI